MLKRYDWHEIDNLHRKLCLDILNSKYQPDIIIGILRSGMIPAVHLAYLLNVNEVGSIFVRSTRDESIDSPKLEIPIVKFDTVTNNVKEKKVLLVDSVIGTGNSFYWAIKELEKYSPFEIRTCVINDNPSLAKEKKPKMDYFAEFVDNWLYYPWEH